MSILNNEYNGILNYSIKQSCDYHETKLTVYTVANFWMTSYIYKKFENSGAFFENEVSK